MMPRVRRCWQSGYHAIVILPNHYCSRHFEHEAEYLASRKKRARSHVLQYTHKYNTIKRNRNDDKSQQYKFYRFKLWVGLRKQVLQRDYFLCQYCNQQGKLTSTSWTVDHIFPIEFDSSRQSDINNPVTIYPAFHRLKTDWEQSYYGIGQGNELKQVKALNGIKPVVILMNSWKDMK